MAKELFDRGLELMKAKDYAQGCPKIAESQRLDPLPGSLFTWAECEARAGKAATGWSLFQRFLRETNAEPERSKQARRREAAEARMKEIEPSIARLELSLAPGSPADTMVILDGETLAAATLKVPLPLDPGTHSLTLRSGRREHTQRVELEAGALKQLVLRMPEPEESPLAPTHVPATSPAPAPAAEPPAPSSDERTAGATDEVTENSNDALGWAALGVGVAGFALSGVAAAVLLGRKSNIDRNCSGSRCNDAGYADAKGVPLWNILGTTGFVVGVAGVGSGIWLLTASDEPQRAPQAHGAGLSWTGTW